MKLKHRIEAEYGYFDDQVKFNSDYNLQKFLREKSALRDKNKTQNVLESESIVERIGESSSLSSKRLPVVPSKGGKGRPASASNQPIPSMK